VVEDQQMILVVDDDDAIRDVVSTVLAEEGYVVVTAASGEEALAVLDQGEPTLVMLDMRMPVMDGWEFAKHLRERFDDRIPVVVMTAAVDAAKRAEQVSAAASVSKPFDLDELVRLVREVIGAPRAASSAGARERGG
jgi:CheY-like chemotaxis protein